MECYIIYDDLLSAFFCDQSGLLVIIMIAAALLVASCYTSFYRQFSADDESDRRLWILYSLIEMILLSGIASHLHRNNFVRYHSTILFEIQSKWLIINKIVLSTDLISSDHHVRMKSTNYYCGIFLNNLI